MESRLSHLNVIYTIIENTTMWAGFFHKKPFRQLPMKHKLCESFIMRKRNNTIQYESKQAFITDALLYLYSYYASNIMVFFEIGSNGCDFLPDSFLRIPENLWLEILRVTLHPGRCFEMFYLQQQNRKSWLIKTNLKLYLCQQLHCSSKGTYAF